MSIIQEALKKAQTDEKAPEVRPAAPAPELKKIDRTVSRSTRPVSRRPVTISRFIGPIVAIIAVVVAMLFLLLVLLKGRTDPSAGAPASNQEVSYRPIPKPSTAAGDVTEPLQKAALAVNVKGAAGYPDLLLNGIMYREEGPRAIINNVIVEEGDLVSGAKVTKITQKSVVLEFSDVEITLNLK